MKIVIAIDSFKGSLSSIEAGKIVEKALQKVMPKAETIVVPVADGGEGTVFSLVHSKGGEIEYAEVTGPLGNRVKASYGTIDDGKTGVIEMASASGLHLVPKQKRNPLLTTTFGTGELIKILLDKNVRKVIVGIGGSATVDCGAGMAQALGAKLLDKDGKQIGFGGGELGRVEKIITDEIDERVGNASVIVASDVESLLLGEEGAVRIYGPQKGADEEMMSILEKNFIHFSKLIRNSTVKDVTKLKGAGAAGGLGAGLYVFLNAKIVSGIDLILKEISFEKKLENADLLITGEGKLDYQSMYGKTISGLAKIARRKKIPVIAVAGKLGEGVEKLKEIGISKYFSIADSSISEEESIIRAEELLYNSISRNFKMFLKNY